MTKYIHFMTTGLGKSCFQNTSREKTLPQSSSSTISFYIRMDFNFNLNRFNQVWNKFLIAEFCRDRERKDKRGNLQTLLIKVFNEPSGNLNESILKTNVSSTEFLVRSCLYVMGSTGDWRTGQSQWFYHWNCYHNHDWKLNEFLRLSR